jgi:hypothetical protein
MGNEKDLLTGAVLLAAILTVSGEATACADPGVRPIERLGAIRFELRSLNATMSTKEQSAKERLAQYWRNR